LASDPPLTYFDEHTFTEMVKKVSVSNTAIEFELINGMKLSEERTEK
jgi:site-specific DNA recombinase